MCKSVSFNMGINHHTWPHNLWHHLSIVCLLYVYYKYNRCDSVEKMLNDVHCLKTRGKWHIWGRLSFEMVNIKASGLKEANAQLSGKFPPPRKTHYPSVLDSQDFPLSSFLPRAFNLGHPQPRGFRSPQLSHLFNSRVNREEWTGRIRY